MYWKSGEVHPTDEVWNKGFPSMYCVISHSNESLSRVRLKSRKTENNKFSNLRILLIFTNDYVSSLFSHNLFRVTFFVIPYFTIGVRLQSWPDSSLPTLLPRYRSLFRRSQESFTVNGSFTCSLTPDLYRPPGVVYQGQTFKIMTRTPRYVSFGI